MRSLVLMQIMKITIACLFFLFGFNAWSQKPNCQKFRDGHFVLEDQANGNTYITRKGKSQIELQDYTKLKMEFTVKWLDDCTYSLKVKKVIENPRNLKIPTDLVVLVKILETTEKTYIQQSSSKGIDFKMTSEIRSLD
jgi:hypothetical protein